MALQHLAWPIDLVWLSGLEKENAELRSQVSLAWGGTWQPVVSCLTAHCLQVLTQTQEIQSQTQEIQSLEAEVCPASTTQGPSSCIPVLTSHFLHPNYRSQFLQPVPTTSSCYQFPHLVPIPSSCSHY